MATSKNDLSHTETVGSYNELPSAVDVLREAIALIEALTPKEAPEGTFLIKGVTGLNIMKNDMLPENTVMVSKRLFDLIYESGAVSHVD